MCEACNVEHCSGVHVWTGGEEASKQSRRCLGYGGGRMGGETVSYNCRMLGLKESLVIILLNKVLWGN